MNHSFVAKTLPWPLWNPSVRSDDVLFSSDDIVLSRNLYTRGSWHQNKVDPAVKLKPSYCSLEWYEGRPPVHWVGNLKSIDTVERDTGRM